MARKMPALEIQRPHVWRENCAILKQAPWKWHPGCHVFRLSLPYSSAVINWSKTFEATSEKLSGRQSTEGGSTSVVATFIAIPEI